MENGHVHVWDAHAVLTNSPSLEQVPHSSSAFVSFSEHASGPIKALQFNALIPTQLATGGSDGKVLIVDLDDPTQQPPWPPNGDKSQQQRAPITALAWNTQVSHILASAAADGTVSVWDIKTRKAWCELHCGSNEAVSDIQWNPSQGLHLLTASVDDRKPVIKLWDLRASTSMPLATLSGGHSQGILSIAWCPHDEHLLMSYVHTLVFHPCGFCESHLVG